MSADISQELIAKKEGLILHEHVNDVLNAAIEINKEKSLNEDVFYWFAVLHDVGKANPLFIDNMMFNYDEDDYTTVCRHEICSFLFCDIVPVHLRETVRLCVLSHHKDIEGAYGHRSITNMFDERPNILYRNHISGIENWGEDIRKFLDKHFSISIEVPSYEQCKKMIDDFVNDWNARLRKDKSYLEYRDVCRMADHIASKKYNESLKV